MNTTDTKLEEHESHYPPIWLVSVKSLPPAWCGAMLALAVVAVLLLGAAVAELDLCRRAVEVLARK